MSSIQETKVLGGQPKDQVEQTARGHGWTVACEGCGLTDNGGKTSGVAVAVRTHIGLSKSITLDAYAHFVPDGRFALKVAVCAAKGGTHIGSLYLKSAVGITAKYNLGLLEVVTAILDDVSGPWIIGGDWNTTPQLLRGAGWLERVGGVAIDPGLLTPTCHGKVYDFLFAPNISHRTSLECVLSVMEASILIRRSAFLTERRCRRPG